MNFLWNKTFLICSRIRACEAVILPWMWDTFEAINRSSQRQTRYSACWTPAGEQTDPKRHTHTYLDVGYPEDHTHTHTHPLSCMLSFAITISTILLLANGSFAHLPNEREQRPQSVPPSNRGIGGASGSYTGCGHVRLSRVAI